MFNDLIQHVYLNMSCFNQIYGFTTLAVVHIHVHYLAIRIVSGYRFKRRTDGFTSLAVVHVHAHYLAIRIVSGYRFKRRSSSNESKSNMKVRIQACDNIGINTSKHVYRMFEEIDIALELT